MIKKADSNNARAKRHARVRAKIPVLLNVLA